MQGCIACGEPLGDMCPECATVGTTTPTKPADRKVIEAAREILRRWDLGPSELYEEDAAAFQRDTGLMAPGKDVPAAIGSDDHERRSAAWRDWCATVLTPRLREPLRRAVEAADMRKLNGDE